MSSAPSQAAVTGTGRCFRVVGAAVAWALGYRRSVVSVLGERNVPIVELAAGVAPELRRTHAVAALAPDDLAIVGPAVLVRLGEQILARSAARRADRVKCQVAEPNGPRACANRVPAT